MTTLFPLILAAVLAQAPAPTAPAPTKPADAQPASAEFPDAEALLDALEHADDTIDTFQADIVYDKVFMLQADRHTRYGKLCYVVDDRNPQPPGSPPLRTFAVTFDSLVFDGNARPDEQAWIFDGRWLIEKRFDEKQYVAREIAPPGSKIDPLRLGEGPLPIPIGQRKDDILQYYLVQLLPTLDGFDPEDPAQANYMANLDGATHLALTPTTIRVDIEQFSSISIWYRRNADGILLPILARTFDRAGDETFVQLTNIHINQPIPEDVIDNSPPPRDSGWTVQIERYRADKYEPVLRPQFDVPPQFDAPPDEPDATEE